MIIQAFHDSLQTRHGIPTQNALDAFEWLGAHTDWTRHHRPAPPPELRSEFYLSFEWCCRWLNEDPDRIREQGLKPCANFTDGQTRREWVRGLPDVKRVWEVRAAARF